MTYWVEIVAGFGAFAIGYGLGLWHRMIDRQARRTDQPKDTPKRGK